MQRRLVFRLTIGCALLVGGPAWAQPGTFFLVIPDTTVEYDPVTGFGELSVRPTFEQDPTDPNFPVDTQGLSFGIAHDPALLDVVALDQLEILSVMNGGTGPSLWVPILLDTGVVLGVIWSLPGTDLLPFPAPTEILELSYETVPGAFIGNDDGEVTNLQWSETLSVPGGPPVEIVVLVDGAVGISLTFNGMVTLEPINDSFLRGDSTNDGSLTLVDALEVLNYLFVFPDPVPPCLDAADADDNGSVQITDPVHVLNFLFVPASPPPSAPFPECGQDPTDDELECETPPAVCI